MINNKNIKTMKTLTGKSRETNRCRMYLQSIGVKISRTVEYNGNTIVSDCCDKQWSVEVNGVTDQMADLNETLVESIYWTIYNL